MTIPTAHPQLRQIEPVPLYHRGQRVFLLRDPLQLATQAVLLPQFLAPVLYLFDGSRDLKTVQDIFDTEFALPVTMDTLEEVVRLLDEFYLLKNERAAHAEARALKAYRATPTRAPALAGQSYPADPAALHRLLQDYLEAAEPARPLDGSRPRGLLSPHIDYPRGGPVYAQVWKQAAALVQQAELVVILGTDHRGGFNPLTLTRQNYATPYGVLPTEQGVVQALAEAIGEEQAFEGELYHRSEHAIELVSIWLQHMRAQKPVPIVPILVGNFGEYEENPPPIEENALIDRVVAALQQATAGRNAVYLVSGDLSHVGPAFGNPPLAAEDRLGLQATDERLLAHLAAGDAGEFFRAIQRTRNETNVCGATPLYLALRALGEVEGAPLGYTQCPTDDGGASVVSVCGMIFGEGMALTAAALAALEAMPEVRRAGLAGDHLRAITALDTPAETVGAALLATGIGEVNVEAVEASLEDVFLALAVEEEGPASPGS